MRTKGSCRFEPYFKVEQWIQELMCWKPIQRSHKTMQAAKLAAPEGKLFRVIEISEKGTTIVV